MQPLKKEMKKKKNCISQILSLISSDQILHQKPLSLNCSLLFNVFQINVIKLLFISLKMYSRHWALLKK